MLHQSVPNDIKKSADQQYDYNDIFGLN